MKIADVVATCGFAGVPLNFATYQRVTTERMRAQFWYDDKEGDRRLVVTVEAMCTLTERVQRHSRVHIEMNYMAGWDTEILNWQEDRGTRYATLDADDDYKRAAGLWKDARDMIGRMYPSQVNRWGAIDWYHTEPGH